MGAVFMFGRYKGKSVAAVEALDFNYLLWVLSQPWFRDKHPALWFETRRRLAKNLHAAVEEDRLQRERAMRPSGERFRFVPAAEFADLL